MYVRTSKRLQHISVSIFKPKKEAAQSDLTNGCISIFNDIDSLNLNKSKFNFILMFFFKTTVK